MEFLQDELDMIISGLQYQLYSYEDEKKQIEGNMSFMKSDAYVWLDTSDKMYKRHETELKEVEDKISTCQKLIDKCYKNKLVD